ncbi:alpha-L-fucosidase [Thermoflavifilum thermophilum]|uniref:alpha-L-fucosidase n=1 Tax=Thermoflavifilum thermophilum TaxID=1393122 RepID=A0A1I7NJX7_9BACT|nr:alpha-L-fucosidase [Thermoflavifilum thermophilum]SFV34856.1 alpha-L-fucosidase [Thermoflavifilum thermophilum]
MKRAILLLITVFCSFQSALSQQLRALDPLPTAAQLHWQSLQMIAIIHFGLNTFTNQEWGYGDVSPNTFHPARFDPDQIVEAAKAAGIRGIILVAKHHDGFCLWPTKTTDYSVRASSWMQGQGDVVRAFAEACRRAGLAFGIYCSPWDRHSADYGNYRYVQLYRQQWQELATQYGPLFECWFDGANGGTGYYGGAREKRIIDRSHYYGWDTTWALIRHWQPGAVIFSDVGPDVRWVGNERGYAADSTWETFTPQSPDNQPPAPGHVLTRYSPYGTANGKFWMPTECDVPLRPGWFYHPEEEGKQKTPQQLWEIYVHSVGRAGVMNLGLAPTPDGILDTQDVRILRAFGTFLKQVFDTNLLKTARLTGPEGMSKANAARLLQRLTDGHDTTGWLTPATWHSANLVCTWPRPQTFRLIQLKEDIRFGQHIRQVRVEAMTSKGWETLARVRGIGANRLIELPTPVTTRALRFHIETKQGFALSEMGIYSYFQPPTFP